MLKIGLDIDDCLANFWESYCDYFSTDTNPKHLNNEMITYNVQNILRKDRAFWVNLKCLNHLDFNPVLYCTKRVNLKDWTKCWLERNELPIAPIYQVFYQGGRKSKMVKGKVDLFIDDSISNMIEMNLAGIPCLLYNTENNGHWGPVGRLYSLKYDDIVDTYNLFVDTMFPNFKMLVDD